MAYEYGSEDLGIRNPFRFEGALRASYGLILTLLGCWTVFSVQGRVAEGGRASGMFALAVGAVLLVFGLTALARGLFQVMRFFVGRAVPASLAQEKHGVDEHCGYTNADLEQMLLGRKNPTFSEPAGWVTRAAYSLIPDLLFLPHEIRKLARLVVRSLVITGTAFLSYGFAWFSGTVGLTQFTETPAMAWLGLFLSAVVIWTWARTAAWVSLRALRTRKGHEPEQGDGSVSSIALGLLFAAAIALPAIGFFVDLTGLPEMPLPAGKYIALATVLGLLCSGLLLLLTFLRAKSAAPVTEVSEYRDNWQESIHPQEVFINFENIIMANRRYREIPNRVYRDYDATLLREGSRDKGSFEGAMTQEVQPVYQELPVSNTFKLVRRVSTTLAFLLLITAALLFYAGVDTLGSASTTPVERFDAVAIPATLALFGWLLVAGAHLFWAEMHFTSALVYFRCEGTYTESKMSTGASIYDSTRSENTVVRSSMTPWIVCSRLVTSTFAGVGRDNLEWRRYILEMRKDDELLDAILTEVQEFLGSRQVIANVGQQDLEAAALIHQVNEQTRSTVRPREHIELPRETADRYLRGPETTEDEASQSG